MYLVTWPTIGIIVKFIILAQILISSGNHYEKPCANNSDCLTNDCLTNDCITNNICRHNGKCMCEKWAHWDPTIKECLTLSRFVCTLGDKSCLQNSECIKISESSRHGLCTCKEGFLETTDRLCVNVNSTFDSNTRSNTTTIDNYDDFEERRSTLTSANKLIGHYKKPCTSHFQCINADIFLECQNNACICYQSSLYDENLKKCVAKPNTSCFVPKTPCGSNATCNPILDNFMGICKCDLGFEISHDGNNCVVADSNQNQTQKNPAKKIQPLISFGFYGKNCSSNEDCENLNILFCQENKCSCPTNSSFWDQNDKICRSRDENFCSEDIPCVENAICFFSICQCYDDYQRNPQGSCIPIENLVIDHDLEEHSPNYLAYVGWILAAIFFIVLLILTAFLAFKKWKNSRPSDPVSYNIHENEGTNSIQIHFTD